MVKFSDREDIERWLGRIKPAKRRREVAVALAARAALRVIPMLGLQPQGKMTRAAILSDRILPSFRATIVAWSVAKYPARGNELRAAAHYARNAAATAATAIAADARTASYAGTAANAANAAVAAATAATAAVASVATEATAAAAIAASAAYTTGTGAIAAAAAAAAAADAADAAFIESGRSGAELSGLPLWPGSGPDWAREPWRWFESTVLATDEGWEVWTDWYAARLAGDSVNSPNEALEIARAKIPEEIWAQGSVVVNAEIKRLITEHTSLTQRPAAFQFRVVRDKIDALPEDARPIDADTARDFYDEAKRKTQALKDRLLRAQADENIRAHVDLVLARIGDSYSEMRPGLMLSALRSLESDVRAYEGEEGRKELSAAHLSNILDLTESVRDLCAIFPRSREIEAEAVSLGLPMERMPEIREAIEHVVAKVNHSDGATDGGREAINASAADLAHQRGLAEEAKQSAYFLVDFANFARAGLKHLKSAGTAIGREVGGLGADSWRAIRRGAPKGVERGAAQMGKAIIVGGVGALMHALGSDLAALGSMVAAYTPLNDILQRMSHPSADAPKSGAPPTDDSDDLNSAPAPEATTESAEREAQLPRVPTPRKPKARRPPSKTSARRGKNRET